MSETAHATPIESAAAETPAAETVTPSAAVEAKPGFLDNVIAALQTKTSLLAEVSTYKTRAETAEAALEEASADLTAARAELAIFTAERARIAEQLTAAQAETASAETAAAKIVATIGFKPEALPAAEAEPPATKEQLVSRMETEADNRKRWELAKQINEMN
jgi:chromosome segregation ATPase